jgi:hypothetical protein
MQTALETERLSDFDHPLEALEGCHAYFEDQVLWLRELAARSRVQVCDESMRIAAVGLIRYFDTAGRLHYEDEERDLLPSLAAAALGPNAGRVALLVRQVEQQHRAMEQAWTSVKRVLARIAHGESAPLHDGALDRFVRCARAHIELTKTKLIPLAAVLLDPSELRVVGRGMAQRRGVPSHALPCLCDA